MSAVLTDSMPSSTGAGWARLTRRAFRTRAQGRRAIHLRVLSDVLFRDALLRERRRADRFGQPFAALLVEVTPRPGHDESRTWAAVKQAITVAKRETDVLGWFEPRAVLGLILSDIALADGSVAIKVERRVLEELNRRLDEDALATVSVRRYEHSVAAGAAAGVSPVDPLLEALPAGRTTRVRRVAKRALDIAGSLGFLLAFSPLFAVIAALVKATSPGPVFFRQVRIGSGGKPFGMVKFRSMYQNAGHALHQDYVTWFIKSSGQHKRADGEIFKLQHDPRITRVGHFIRRTSLDELPQFWNVLRGQMSLVGPRPPLPFEVEQYQPWHLRRVFDAKPGVTGLWQVTGRSRTTFDEMVRLDLRYARSHSLWTDIKILAATPAAMISGKGAC
jgi:lipopolysaccharide/colanic/teichoic acid biosynthesis glycosyltransferase